MVYKVLEDQKGGVEHFIADCCILDKKSVIDLRDLYSVYFKWCDNNDYKNYSSVTFSRRLESAAKVNISRGRKVVCEGIRVKYDYHELPTSAK